MEGRDEDGRFSVGNRFWEARSSHGANPKFETAEQLADACQQYFTWNHENPLFADQLVTFRGHATHEPVAKMRAMTLAGLCMFIDVSKETWNEWRKSRSDLSDVITRAEAVIYRQKFEGASADLLNGNIIARDLGLADKSEVTGKEGAPLIPERSDIEVARGLAFLLAKGAQEVDKNG